MKIITLLLIIAGISAAQAEVYKCPGKAEGKYIYQEMPCKGAKAGEHTVKIIPADEKKIAEAQAKLAGDLKSDKGEDQSAKPKTEANNVKVPANNTTTATTNGTAAPVVNSDPVKRQAIDTSPTTTTTTPPANPPTNTPPAN